MTQTTSEILHELNVASKSGTISKSSTDELNKFSSALCHAQAYTEFGEREFPQVCETVRLHLLRSHIETLQNYVIGLQNHITDLNRKNSITQYCVIALTAFAILFGAIQVYYARESDIRAKEQLKQSQQVEKQQQALSLQSLGHNLQAPQLGDQAISEKVDVNSLQVPHENK